LEVTGHFQFPATTVIERDKTVNLIEGWVNLTAELEVLKNRKICFFCPDCKNINDFTADVLTKKKSNFPVSDDGENKIN
jgi:phage FluMu protein Com